jgi:diaminopimelate epimerase
MSMRVFERGVGETLACGTGACAAAVAAYVSGRAPLPVEVRLLGGELFIEYADGEDVHMTGPAATAFKGSVEL